MVPSQVTTGRVPEWWLQLGVVRKTPKRGRRDAGRTGRQRSVLLSALRRLCRYGGSWWETAGQVYGTGVMLIVSRSASSEAEEHWKGDEWG